MELNICRLHPEAKLPTRATQGAAGFDLYARLDAPLTIAPGARCVVPTGLAIALPSAAYVALVYARSGLAVMHGLTLSNCVGVVDSDYRGEIRVGLINQSDKAYTIQPQERIAQLVVAPVLQPQLREVDTLDQTDRGGGGFGSTGKI